MRFTLPNSDLKVFLLNNFGTITNIKAPGIEEMPYSFMSYNKNREFECEGYLPKFDDDVFDCLFSMLNDDYNNSSVRVFDRRNGIMVKELV